MAKQYSAKNIKQQASKEAESQLELNKLTRDEFSTLEKIFTIKGRIAKVQQDYNDKVDAANLKLISYQEQINEYEKDHGKMHGNTVKSLQNEVDKQKKILELEKKKAEVRIRNLKILESIDKAMTKTMGFLQTQDKIIRSTNIALGLSGAKADMIRNSFEQTAGFAARYGASLQDIGTLMTSFADETGRVKMLSDDMLKSGVLIAQATGMGSEAAGRMAGQFELLGMNMSNTADYVEGIMETSERMGVNSNKVFKLLSSNFNKLQKYTFQNGVKGMAKMAQYSEKFKLDMAATLDSADKARTLEGAIDMMANLQVMGGEFAKADPFEMLYLSRNAPDEYIKKIGDMTKGIAHFKRMSDGTFESFISPVDMDRLANVSKTLGIDMETLTKTTRRMGEIQAMRKQMAGMGLSKEQQELVEGMYNFDKKTGKFSVELAGVTRDVNSLTTDELRILKGQKKSLEDRAESAMTFNDVMKATIEELKTTLLPMLRGVNKVLVTIKPVITAFLDGVKWLSKSSFAKGLLGAFGVALAAATLFKAMVTPFLFASKLFTSSAALKTFAGGTLQSGMAGKGVVGGMNAGKGVLGGSPLPAGAPAGGGAGGAGRGAIKKGIGGAAAGIGAGIGMAAVGVGAGIGAAAAGISLLANAMSKLDPKQLEVLQGITNTIGIVVGVGALFAAVVIGIGMSMGAAAAPVGAFGLAVLGIGAGIGIAAAGIGLMGAGMSLLINSTKGAGDGMFKVAGGLAAINLAMMSGGIAGLLGGGGMVLGLTAVANKAPAITAIGNAFKEINTALTASDESFTNVRDMITAISTMDASKLSPLKDLKDLFNKPLMVEFKDKNIAVTSDITLVVDGKKILSGYNVGKDGTLQSDSQKRGTSGSRSIGRSIFG